MSTALQRATPWTRLKPLITIVGCTGTGKSQLAIDLATHFNGEIINADALQIYRGLPVATNKVTKEEMRGIPHHLLNCVSLDDPPWYSAKFVKEAEKVIDDIWDRGKIPIVTGGTHYYVHSLLSGNSPILPDTAGSEANSPHRWPILQSSSAEMLDELRRLDPVAASWWHPKESQRIRRSLEICLQSGSKVSQIYERRHKGNEMDGQIRLRHNALCFYLHADRVTLNSRLDARVDRMIEAGLIDEARSMWDLKKRKPNQGRDIDTSRGVWIAIGFKEFEPYFQETENASKQSLHDLHTVRSEACSRTKISTRQYAKRQTNYVRNKLIPLFHNSNNHSLLQALDTSHLDKWTDLVLEPAKGLTRLYLENSENIAMNADQLIDPSFLKSAPQVKVTNCCSYCNVTTTTEESWQAHLRSKRHKVTLKRQSSSYELLS